MVGRVDGTGFAFNVGYAGHILSYYASGGWALAGGVYRVSIGSNERDLPVTAAVHAG